MNSLGTSLDTVHQFVLGLVIIFILFSIGVIFFLFIYTHRMTGPILALLRFAKNPQGNLKLRKGDLHEKEIIEISTFLGPIS
jgi:hypothetical protein